MTRRQKNSTTRKNKGYYTQGDENNWEDLQSLFVGKLHEDRNILTAVEHMSYIEKIPDIQQMPASDHNRPLFPVNYTKMPANYQMPASEQESPPLPDNDTNMPDYDKMTDKKHISGECPFFNTS